MDNRTFFSLVEQELQGARAKHPPMHSAHEGFAIILEEVDELKAEVWKKGSAREPKSMRAELIQIAAMCARMADDLDL
ncbi:MAG: hypothetical protein GX552_06325 [Chloroflexi bacterium]|jgi:hypothetical protein|nr:hypothetical protein [Chloroflexota bacterium]